MRLPVFLSCCAALTVAIFAPSAVPAAEGFVEEFRLLADAGDDAKTRAFIESSAETEKENPDYYATAGNFWWQLALTDGLNVSTKPSEGGEFSIRDPDTGEEVGSIGPSRDRDPDLARKAADVLAEGARRFPARADIVLGLAHVRKETGMRAECVDALVSVLRIAKEDPARLRWTGDADLPSAADVLLPDTAQGYCAGLFRLETAEADALCSKLCDAVIEAFPDQPMAYNMKAALADANKRPEEALRWLESAAEKGPKDPLIQMNLARAYLGADRSTDASNVLRRLLEFDDLDPADRARAQAMLDDMLDETAPGDAAPAKDE